MPTLQISISDMATPHFKAFNEAIKPNMEMNLRIAAAVSNRVKEQFVEMAASNHNKFGVRSSFWSKMRDGTSPTADADAGYVSMPIEAAARRYGSTITPKGHTFLAIPARAEAYGMSPTTFALQFVQFPSGSAALVAKETGGKGKNKTSEGGVYYWLRRSVTINPDENVTPDDNELGDAVVKGMTLYIGSKMRASASGNESTESEGES